jgi:hypothetical protein
MRVKKRSYADIKSRMGYLGLSEPIEKQDGLLRRIFWPGNGACDVDALGQRGFWLCAVVGAGSFLVYLVQGHWIIALLTLAFFWLGGVGVREHNTPAATLVTLAYLLNLLGNLMTGAFPGVIAFGAAALLISNIRGTWIAARYAKSGEPQQFPERMRGTWRDRLVDQMPPIVWPKARVAFFAIATIYIALSVVGTVFVIRHPKRPPASTQEQQSVSIEVRPSS